MTTLPIIAIRPQPGCSTTVAAGQALGLVIAAHPLFAIQQVAWDAPDPATIDALLIGSANAIRHGGKGLAQYLDKPAYAVGEATAAAAKTAGLAVAAIGSGGLQGVIDQTVPPGLTLLRLSGEEHVPLNIPPQTRIITRIVYRSQPQPVGADLAEMLRPGALVLLHSAAAANHFSGECDRLGVPRSAIRLAALGPRIAQAAGEGWEALASATHPQEGELLALAGEMCH